MGLSAIEGVGSAMSGDQTGRGMPGGMPDINAMMAQVMAVSGGRGGFPGIQMQQAPKEEGVAYLCVTDLQITDRKMGKPLSQSTTDRRRADRKFNRCGWLVTSNKKI